MVSYILEIILGGLAPEKTLWVEFAVRPGDPSLSGVERNGLGAAAPVARLGRVAPEIRTIR